jgi:hypothetical protein
MQRAVTKDEILKRTIMTAQRGSEKDDYSNSTWTTHRSVRALLAGVFPGTTFQLHVDVVDDVEEVLHDGHFSVDRLAGGILKREERTI